MIIDDKSQIYIANGSHINQVTDTLEATGVFTYKPGSSSNPQGKKVRESIWD